jgi:hypothetical protein
MTAKEQLLAEAPGWTEEQAHRALRAARDKGSNDATSSQEGEQPPLTCIGMFNSGRGDLSERASRDEFEPQPFR